MGRRLCCSKVELKKGHWTSQEDKILADYVRVHGEGKWRDLAQKTGLRRCGKSCRLRWLNYLRPGIKLGNISEDEEDLIIKLHRLLGNRWTLIAGRLPGRSGNEIKNYWNTTLSKKVIAEKNKHSRLNTELAEKKAEYQPQPVAATTTAPPSMQPNGPNPATTSTKTGCNPPHESQRADQAELINDNETSFREYMEASISSLPATEINDDFLSFWMDSYEIELFSTDALDAKAQHQQNNSEDDEALGEYDFSFDIFS